MFRLKTRENTEYYHLLYLEVEWADYEAREEKDLHYHEEYLFDDNRAILTDIKAIGNWTIPKNSFVIHGLPFDWEAEVSSIADVIYPHEEEIVRLIKKYVPDTEERGGFLAIFYANYITDRDGEVECITEILDPQSWVNYNQEFIANLFS